MTQREIKAVKSEWKVAIQRLHRMLRHRPNLPFQNDICCTFIKLYVSDLFVISLHHFSNKCCKNETYSVMNCEKRGNCHWRDKCIIFLSMEFNNKKCWNSLNCKSTLFLCLYGDLFVFGDQCLGRRGRKDQLLSQIFLRAKKGSAQ